MEVNASFDWQQQGGVVVKRIVVVPDRLWNAFEENNWMLLSDMSSNWSVARPVKVLLETRIILLEVSFNSFKLLNFSKEKSSIWSGCDVEIFDKRSSWSNVNFLKNDLFILVIRFSLKWRLLILVRSSNASSSMKLMVFDDKLKLSKSAKWDNLSRSTRFIWLPSRYSLRVLLGIPSGIDLKKLYWQFTFLFVNKKETKYCQLPN